MLKNLIGSMVLAMHLHGCMDDQPNGYAIIDWRVLRNEKKNAVMLVKLVFG